MRLALAIAREHGACPGRSAAAAGAEAIGRRGRRWRRAFLLAPYLRDTFVACGVLSETFETAITWDRFEEFHADAMEAVRAKVAEVCDAPAESRRAARQLPLHPRLSRRPRAVLHGAGPGGPGGEVEQWGEIKAPPRRR